jgi:hypothetical protein
LPRVMSNRARQWDDNSIKSNRGLRLSPTSIPPEKTEGKLRNPHVQRELKDQVIYTYNIPDVFMLLSLNLHGHFPLN